jgi:DNA-binding FadR family transcriptional regulator
VFPGGEGDMSRPRSANPAADGREDVPVADLILGLIRERGLRPGDKLPTESELSKAFAASRQKVREGLLDLESIGLIRSRQGSGRILLDRQSYSLPALLGRGIRHSPQDILEAVVVRQVLEVGFVQSAIPVVDDVAVARMHAAIAEMKVQAAANKPFPKADREFHNALYLGLNNQLLSSLLDNFWSLFESVDLHALQHREGAHETVGHHERILEAVKRGDGALARFHMELHFYDSYQSLRSFVTDSNGSIAPATSTAPERSQPGRSNRA